MNRSIIAVAVIAALGLSACSTTKPTAGMNQPSDSQVAVKDTTIATDFKDEGIKIFYSLTGNLERIEVYGIAPAWKGNQDIIAEADAMDKLVKFVHGKTVTADRRVKIMSRTLDRARDNTLNRFKNSDGLVSFTADDVETEIPSAKSDSSSRDNTSRRVADRVENTLVTTVNRITAQGRLTGVRKIGDRLLDDGKIYVAVYQWSERDQTASEFIRNRMR